ncbi:CBS domain-containing protein [Alteromonas oceanisediminis]|uniref:CBS domain-containing protein n=1 Tax=Alteromonas oceanisediminis TaxID=2836180 RepID=UPI001BD978DD|nr:CBS domain-containing protein [Alteromonas oceanisediminis]MBT0587596.1 CBS domain-containing protein [Alteromonas oceanisediminis]
MNALSLYAVQNSDHLAWPENNTSLSVHMPAVAAFTDFRQHRPVVISSSQKASDVERLMRQAHVKLQLVLDKHDNFVGLVSYNDITEDKIMMRVAQGQSRDDLLVSDFMQHRASLCSFDYGELLNATISDVLETQQNNHQQHCLVTDRTQHEIRGLISARDVARLLKRSVDIYKHISFEGLFNEMAA